MDSPGPPSPDPNGAREADEGDLSAELAALRARYEALRESERMYRFSAELSGRLVWSTDSEGKVLSMSRMFGLLTGIADEQALKDGWMQAVHPEDRERIEAKWTACLKSGDPFVAEFRGLLADGSTRMALSRAIAVRDEGGKILRWYGSSEDVQEEREAERGRQEAEARYRLAARATNDAVWDYDIKEGSIDWSDTAARVLGYEDELGRTPLAWWEERVHPEDRARVVESLGAATRSGGDRWSEVYRFRRADGSYADVFDRGFIIRSAEGEAVRAVGAMADLTERNRSEAEIRRMQSELIHVSRFSAMGTMASTLAHEINQPLTAVTNFVRGARRIMERTGETDPALIEALRSAEAGALRAGEIVRRLRELVSRGTAAISDQHLPTLVGEAGVLAFVDEGRLGVRHEVTIDPDAEWVRADRIQVQQVLINLARNAIEAMQRGPVRKVVISARRSGRGMVEIRVADTGPGIAPEHMDDLFSQFMTTKKEGLGIGLPISRTIVEAHGGKIWAENAPAGGAVFCFTLPAARGKGARSG